MAAPLCPGVAADRGGRWALPAGPRAAPRVELPPTNVTPELARVLTPLPYGEACNVHGAGAPLYEVWYRLTAIANQYQIGFQASPEALSSYAPVVAIYTGSASSLTPYLQTAAAGALQIPVTPGTSYFFRVRHSGGTIATGIVMLTIATRVSLNATAPAGSILINDDVSGYPLVAVSSTGSGVLQSRPFPSGETAAILPSGISLWEDRTDNAHLYLYDATLTQIAAPAWTRFGSAPPMATNGSNRFYVGDSRSGGAQIRTVNDTGVMGPTTWTLPVADALIYQLGISPDETIAYYRNAPLGDGPIKRFNLTTSTAMADLVAAPVGARHAGELLTLSDGSTLVGYMVTGTDYVTRYAADGSVAATYPMPGADLQLNRISRALTDASFWVWLWGTGPNEGVDTFVQVRVSDGVYLEQVTSPQYSAGIFMGPIETTSVAAGHALSCPLIIFPPELPPYGAGDIATIAPSYHLDARYIRRLRRAPHVTNEHTRVFFRKFELDLERGQGLATGQGSDPMVLLRISRDGGQTWGEEQRMAAGRLGDYTQRVIARRLGQARDTVFEVVVSDPIAWALVGAWLDLEPGTN